MPLGEVLKFIRTKIFGISLLDFGELMNISFSTLQRYESGDFGKKFNNNRYIKLRDISEKLSSVVFDEYKIVRKSKKFYINNSVTKIGFNKKIKDELEIVYLHSNLSCKENIDKLKNMDISSKDNLTEFIYTFFLLYTGTEITENVVFKKSSSDFIKIVDTGKDRISDYKNCLMEAKGECFITGTSMVHLSEDSADVLVEKVKFGCVKLLILDPDWIEKHNEILTFLDCEEDRKEFSYEIRNSIRKLKAIKRSLPDEIESKMSIKTYSTVFPYIVTGYESKDYGKMVVEITDYVPEKFRPRFTLHKNKGNDLYNIIKRKVYSLWNNTILTKEV
jgi:transcriptional regulator with XRE-family HTH domain